MTQMRENQDIPATTTIASRKPTRTRQLSSTQVMFAVILTIGLMLAIQFSSRITAERDLINIRDTVQQEIELLQRESTELNQQLEFVGSDAYVEEWARREARMVRDGELIFIPVPSANTLQQLQAEQQVQIFATVDTTLPEPENWELWWRLFFDTPPPQFGV